MCVCAWTQWHLRLAWYICPASGPLPALSRRCSQPQPKPKLLLAAACPQEYQYGAEGGEEEAGAAMAAYGAPSPSGRAIGGSFRGGYTEGELLERVQCSAAELRAGLVDHRALCLGARPCRWRCCFPGQRAGLGPFPKLSQQQHKNLAERPHRQKDCLVFLLTRHAARRRASREQMGATVRLMRPTRACCWSWCC